MYIYVCTYVDVHVHVHVECRGFKSHLRQLIFLGNLTALGVLCCFALFVCLTLLASFFLPSHLSFKNMYMYMYTHTHTRVFSYADIVVVRIGHKVPQKL